MDNDEILVAFGKKVQGERQKRDLSQEQLAEIAGLDRTYISSMERGRRNVSLLNIIRVASALSISPSVFLEGIGEINE
jgi:transcriptional regulator with XRE-family HTH domain